MARVLMPIPDRDFDPSEVAVTWAVLTQAGHTVVFATASGTPGMADDLMLTGRGLDPWGFLPGLDSLVALGLVLRANGDARRAYARMTLDPAFLVPLRWDTLRVEDYDGLFLPGGHRARGMRQYLESKQLQDLTVGFFAAGKPVAAICHGVLLAARSIDPATGRSVLHGRKTTALTWAQESAAWRLNKLGRFWDPHYYRTYREAPGQPAGYMGVEQEVTRALADAGDFRNVPRDDPHYTAKTRGTARDTAGDETPAFVVEDGNYLSGRWPGDAHTLARRFGDLLTRSRRTA
ncbi:thiJ/pfpI-family protein [Oleomonas cavernae]|uniref:ThiJ/pfpI-family protein n=1 Tax=Oleomonas cavernae TaxID=2320859 RepID=A0A418WGD8_9PROT|nr:type 1 glutamine amidotransferase domain-containing protein [Oleomonas cavernae]RJF89067.1 thiJ/pfpI-family protein [Oleomonas cavernae]